MNAEAKAKKHIFCNKNPVIVTIQHVSDVITCTLFLYLIVVLSKQFNIYSLQELKLLALLQCIGESLAFTITEGSMKEAVERMETT